LWERYLADRTGVAEERWHEEADKEEHRLTLTETDRLAARMGRPLVDPHGDPIPGASGEMPEVEGTPLADLPDGSHAEVVHLEDEPPEPFRRLVAAGLAPGEHITLAGRDGNGVRVAWGTHSAVLGPEEVAAVTVRTVPAAAASGEPLASLVAGHKARVVGLSPSLHGPQRRRLVDLGFVPGTLVEAELPSALGDPVAYRVRGALIALRREQAGTVLVEPVR
jgi:DtxR family Mn-dependent transcriptional regulator